MLNPRDLAVAARRAASLGRRRQSQRQASRPSGLGSERRAALEDAGTRSVQVVSRCDKDGGQFCDAYFDDVCLVAR